MLTPSPFWQVLPNVETVEDAFPIRYLFRRRMLDSGGAGRYRGGLGGEIAIVPHGSPDGGINFVLSGKGSKFPMSDGLAGGASGTANDYVLFQGGKDKTESTRVDQTQADQLTGDVNPVSWGVFPLRQGDAFYLRWNGGGGVGDPLQRPVADVARDVERRSISADAAQSIYGVVLNNDGVNTEATNALREQLRKERLEQGVQV